MNQIKTLKKLISNNDKTNKPQGEIYTDFIVNSNKTIIKNILPLSKKRIEDVKDVYLAFIKGNDVDITKARRGARVCKLNEIKTSEICSTMYHYLFSINYTDLSIYMNALNRFYYLGYSGVNPEYPSNSVITGISVRFLYMGIDEDARIRIKLTLENEALGYLFTKEEVISLKLFLGREKSVDVPAIQTAPEQCNMNLTIEMLYPNGALIAKDVIENISIR